MYDGQSTIYGSTYTINGVTYDAFNMEDYSFPYQYIEIEHTGNTLTFNHAKENVYVTVTINSKK